MAPALLLRLPPHEGAACGQGKAAGSRRRRPAPRAAPSLSMAARTLSLHDMAHGAPAQGRGFRGAPASLIGPSPPPRGSGSRLAGGAVRLAARRFKGGGAAAGGARARERSARRGGCTRGEVARGVLHAGFCTRDRGVLGGFARFARVFRGGAAYRGAALQAASCTWLFVPPFARSERCTWGLGGGPQGLFVHGGALHAWEVANGGLRGPLHRARGCSGGLHECFCS